MLRCESLPGSVWTWKVAPVSGRGRESGGNERLCTPRLRCGTGCRRRTGPRHRRGPLTWRPAGSPSCHASQQRACVMSG